MNHVLYQQYIKKDDKRQIDIYSNFINIDKPKINNIKIEPLRELNTVEEIKQKLNNYWYSNETNILLDNIIISNTLLQLSTITAEGRLSNINFKGNEKEVINCFELTGNIIRIGCNYKELSSELYTYMTTKVKKSNRGRKPKPKEKSTRKIQGTGKYMNSQIQFTFANDIKKKKIYHIKLFVNGSIQIPAVTDESLTLIQNEINELIKFISQYDIIKIDKEKPIEQYYLISIMNNYKSQLKFYNNIDMKTELYNIKNEIYKMNKEDKQINILNNEIFNMNKEDKIIRLNLRPNDMLLNLDLSKLDILLNLYKNNNSMNLKYKIFSVNYSPEKYTALVLKFITPVIITDEMVLKYKRVVDTKKIKKTTIKIFGSAKINLDGVPSKYVAHEIMNDLINLFNEYKHYLFY